jgi:hypothetical protein
LEGLLVGCPIYAVYAEDNKRDEKSTRERRLDSIGGEKEARQQGK